jgi:hypothetical protein
MSKDNYVTDVIFRVDTTKDFKGIVYALFPHEVNDSKGSVLSFQHVGQHSSADYRHCINKSRLATHTEYNDLKKELESLGYNLNVIKKQNYTKFLESYHKSKN